MNLTYCPFCQQTLEQNGKETFTCPTETENISSIYSNQSHFTKRYYKEFYYQYSYSNIEIWHYPSDNTILAYQLDDKKMRPVFDKIGSFEDYIKLCKKLPNLIIFS